MSIYLNSDKAYENFKCLYGSRYYVDKSFIIEKLNELINTSDRYICITRPRRFGKSSVADMLGAYYSKAVDSKELFDKLNISSCDGYEENLNKYNVINISFNEIPDEMDTYEDYIGMVKNSIKKDISDNYPGINIDDFYNISTMLRATNEKFIFIFDEWDYIFNSNLFEEHQNDFLEFLRNLLKDQPYVALAYMTGVLPIKKYSSGSALNMFDEFTFLKDRQYAEFFGFTEEEVIDLCKHNKKIDYKNLESWYNGYLTAEGIKVYNPRSVVKALSNNHCESYWTNTGAMDEVAEYLKYNIHDIREDVIEMVAGNEIDIIIDEEFRAGQRAPRTKEEIYSAMIVLGFLSYYDGYLRIPNKELMKEFEKALKDESFGYVSQIVENSINGNSASYSFAGVSDSYKKQVFGSLLKGYVDFAFHPRRKNDTAFILELKKDDTSENAIKQIKNKEYAQKFIKENEDRKMVIAAICYDSKEKEHHCLVEEI